MGELERLKKRLDEIENMVCTSNSKHLDNPELDVIKVGQLLSNKIDSKINLAKEKALIDSLHTMKQNYEQAKIDRLNAEQGYAEMMELFIDLIDALKGSKAKGSDELIIPNAMLLNSALKPINKILNEFLKAIINREENSYDGR